MRKATLSDAATTLNPKALSSSAQRAVEAIIREGESKASRASYESAIRYWAGWFRLRYGKPLNDRAFPLPIEVIMTFITDHAMRSIEPNEKPENIATIDGVTVTWGLPKEIEKQLLEVNLKQKPGPMALASLQLRLSFISKAHEEKGKLNPCRTAKIKALMNSVAGGHADRNQLSRGKPAILADALDILLDQCEAEDSLEGLRDAAILAFGWFSGGRRRSEIVAANRKNLERKSKGVYIYHVHKSKSNQKGDARPEDFKPVKGRAGDLLERWLVESGIRDQKSGTLFPKITEIDGKPAVSTEPLRAAWIREMIKRRCGLAGLGDSFSAHSLRSGFVTEAYTRKVPEPQIMDLTGHKNLATVRRYQRGDIARSSEAEDLISGN
jgi:integrase